MGQALAGIRVVAWLGADVIKVEEPGKADSDDEIAGLASEGAI